MVILFPPHFSLINPNYGMHYTPKQGEKNLRGTNSVYNELDWKDFFIYTLYGYIFLRRWYIMIKVFSTTTCPWCTKVKEYLQNKGLEFETVDVSSNREAAMEMVKKTGQMGVPVTQIGEKYIVGFSPEAIEAELAKQDQ